MASLDQQFDVGAQEMSGHGDAASIRQNHVRIIGEFLDIAENIVPASRVEARGVLSQLVEDFIHLESSQDRLDEDGGFDRSGLKTERLLRVYKHVIPQARFEVAFELRQIKIRPCSPSQLLLRVVPEEKPEIKQRPGHRLSVYQYMFLREMPAAGTHQHDRYHGIQLIGLAGRRIGIRDRATDGVAQV